MSRFRVVSLLVAPLLTLAAQVYAQKTTVKDSTFVPAPSAVEVHPVPVSGLAIDLSAAKLQSDFGSGVSLLTFTAMNNTGARVENLRFAAYFVQDNSIIGGQQWCAHEALNSGQKKSYSFPVAHAFTRPTTVLVSVRHAQDPTRAVDMPGSSLREALESLGTIPTDLTPQVSSPVSQPSSANPNVLCDPSFCTTCKSDALQVCGSKGVHQYSCSIQTCTCSFTCN